MCSPLLTNLEHLREGSLNTFLKKVVTDKTNNALVIGKHRVICGDSTGEEVYTRLMDGDRANLPVRS